MMQEESDDLTRIIHTSEKKERTRLTVEREKAIKTGIKLSDQERERERF